MRRRLDLKAGDAVTIATGTWPGGWRSLVALDDHGRAAVLLDLLGRSLRANVDAATPVLEPA